MPMATLAIEWLQGPVEAICLVACFFGSLYSFSKCLGGVHHRPYVRKEEILCMTHLGLSPKLAGNHPITRSPDEHRGATYFLIEERWVHLLWSCYLNICLLLCHCPQRSSMAIVHFILSIVFKVWTLGTEGAGFESLCDLALVSSLFPSLSLTLSQKKKKKRIGF